MRYFGCLRTASQLKSFRFQSWLGCFFVKIAYSPPTSSRGSKASMLGCLVTVNWQEEWMWACVTVCLCQPPQDVPHLSPDNSWHTPRPPTLVQMKQVQEMYIFFFFPFSKVSWVSVFSFSTSSVSFKNDHIQTELVVTPTVIYDSLIAPFN